MEKIKITSDSTCSLSKDMLKQFDISLVYLEIKAGNHAYLDCEEITGDNLFDFHRQTGIFASTIPVSEERFLEFFSGHAADNDFIIHIGSSMEGNRSYINALNAAKNFPSVHVVDTKQISIGTGLMVLFAAKLSQEGALLQEILESLDEYKGKAYNSFLIGAMEYFYHSERCSNFTRSLTSFLHVRPGINVINGRMTANRMYQGDNDSIRRAFINDFYKQLSLMDDEIVVLSSSGCSAAFMQQLYEEMVSHSYFKQVLLVKDSASIASHCGPDTFGIYCFYRNEPKERLRYEIFSVGRR